MSEFIKMQHAHVNQHTSSGVKGDWKIEANETNEALGILPGRLDHNEVFNILDIARKYELEAFNIGINFGKKEQDKQHLLVRKAYEARIHEAIKENERLAVALENLTNIH